MNTLGKCLLAAAASLIALPALAVNCSGVPHTVKMGETGAQEAYAIVRIGTLDYRLGLSTDDATKIRVSLAQTALTADKVLLLRFYGIATCEEASTNRAIPTSTQLVRG